MGAQAKALLKMKHDEINPSDIGIQGGIFIGLTPIDVRALEDNAERSEERRVGKECRSRWSPYH